MHEDYDHEYTPSCKRSYEFGYQRGAEAHAAKITDLEAELARLEVTVEDQRKMILSWQREAAPGGKIWNRVARLEQDRDVWRHLAQRREAKLRRQWEVVEKFRDEPLEENMDRHAWGCARARAVNILAAFDKIDKDPDTEGGQGK